MRTPPGSSQRLGQAATLMEVLVVLAVIVVLAGVLIPALARSKRISERITCISHLKNLGLAHRIFATEHGGQYPQVYSNRFGGSLEGIADRGELWRHFAQLSNEISVPQILHCPADRERPPVTTWAQFTRGRGLSYFLGVEASAEEPQSVLMGDRNVTVDGAPVENRAVRIQRQTVLAFDGRLHRFEGNVGLGDGSVQQVTSASLQQQVDSAFGETNRLTWIYP